MAVFRRLKAPFSRAWSHGFGTQVIDLAASMSTDFYGAREQEKCRAPFSGEDFVDVTRRGRLRSEGDTVSIRRQGESLVLQPIKSAAWPLGFFDRVRIDDPAFARPAQGRVPPAPKMK
jgi:hypothetical protein